MDPSLQRAELTLAQVLPQVPGRTVLGEQLTEGLSNEAWRLSVNGTACALRLTRGVRASRLTVEQEVEVMRAVGGLAPDVVAWGERWLVTRWREPGDPGLLGARLALLHSLPPPPGLRSLTPAQILADLRFPVGMEALQDEASALALQLARPLEVLCHQDLTSGNVRGSWFLDWEYAACGDPRFDLHTVLDRLSPTDAQRVLTRYRSHGGPARPDAAVRRAGQLIDVHWHAVRRPPTAAGEPT